MNWVKKQLHEICVRTCLCNPQSFGLCRVIPTTYWVKQQLCGLSLEKPMWYRFISPYHDERGANMAKPIGLHKGKINAHVQVVHIVQTMIEMCVIQKS